MYIKTVSSSVNFIKATMASGIIIEVNLEDFYFIMGKLEKPLIIISSNKLLLGKMNQYLISYKNFIFFTEDKQPLELPSNVEIIEAEKIWVPRF